MSQELARCGCPYNRTGSIVLHNATCKVAAKVPEQNKSLKFDTEKPALQYVPGQAMEQMGHAFAYGARKYGASNYKVSGLEVSRCIGAALRHIYKFNDGVDKDEESGHSHLGHAMAAIAMAIYMLDQHPSLDDRFKKTK